MAQGLPADLADKNLNTLIRLNIHWNWVLEKVPYMPNAVPSTLYCSPLGIFFEYVPLHFAARQVLIHQHEHQCN